MCKEEGKGFDFFRKTFFFIIEWLRKGARVIYIYIYIYIYTLKGHGRGRGF